jgi:hypothetical protein
MRATVSAMTYAVACTVVAVLTLASCGTADPTPDRMLSTNPYLALQLNIHSAIMSTQAPYDTLRLVATPYLASGAVLQTPAAPVFWTSDDSITVSPDGMVHALGRSSGSTVIVSLQDPVSGVTHADTVVITVTTTAPTSRLTGFAIQRPPTDTGRLAVASAFAARFPTDTVRAIATDSAGNDITSAVQVLFTSSAPNVAVVDPRSGIAYGIRPGNATIVAATTYYGVTKRDSVQLTIDPDAVLARVTIGPTDVASDGSPIFGFSPSTVTLGIGGTVVFGFDLITSMSGFVLDVVFDDSSAAKPSAFPVTVTTAQSGSGNIAPLTRPPTDSLLVRCFDFANYTWGLYRCQAARAFFTPGTYHYHSGQYGATGTIVIRGR